MKSRLIKITFIILFLGMTITLSALKIHETKAANTEGKIFFIKNKDSNSNGIIVYSNGHCGLVDVMNASAPQYKKVNNQYVEMTEAEVETARFTHSENGYYIKLGENNYLEIPQRPVSLSYAENYVVDNGTKVANYVKSIGCDMLDFIVLTHNHSDHISGAKEIAYSGLVNNKTIVFYKEDAKPDDDAEEEAFWYNNAWYLDAYNALTSKNATMCDVSKGCTSLFSSFPGINGFISDFGQDNNPFSGYNTNVDWTYYFNFGSFKINLYNLYIMANHHDNFNSIVTLIEHRTSGKKAILMGDLETMSNEKVAYDRPTAIANPYAINPNVTCEECLNIGIENHVADIVGKVDLVESGHHGSPLSNSYYMMSTFNPKYVINCSKELQVSGIAVLKKLLYDKNNTEVYSTVRSDGAIVADFSNGNIAIKNYDLSGHESSSVLENTIDILNQNNILNGWYKVTNKVYNGNVSEWIYMYFEEGNPVTGWKNIDNAWYHFGDDYVMQRGWIKLNDIWYYLKGNGAMVTGFQVIDGSKYYFNEAGAMQTLWQYIDDKWYFFNESGKMVTGFANISGYLFYMDDNGVMQEGYQTISNKKYYMRTVRDEYVEGPHGACITNTCVYMNNKYTCFNENSVITSETSLVTIPTSSAYCRDLTYNGSNQVLTKTATNFTFSNNVGKAAKSYIVTASINSGYMWADQTTTDKTITCSIKKAVPTVNVVQKSLTIYTDKTEEIAIFTTNVAGEYKMTIANNKILSISNLTVSKSANEAFSLSASGIKEGNTGVEVKFVPSSSNYSEVVNNYTINVVKSKISVSIPTASEYCKEIKYTGEEQILTNSPGIGFAWINNRGTNVGNYTVLAKLLDGYIWSDNSSSNKSIICRILKEDDYIVIDDTVDVDYSSEYITNINENITANNIKNLISTNGTISIINLDGDPVGNSTIVGTGYKVLIAFDTNVIEYILVINGDLTGDGKVKFNDVTKLYHGFRNKIALNDYEFLAGNTVKADDIIGFNDVTKLYRYYSGKINSLS